MISSTSCLVNILPLEKYMQSIIMNRCITCIYSEIMSSVSAYKDNKLTYGKVISDGNWFHSDAQASSYTPSDLHQLSEL